MDTFAAIVEADNNTCIPPKQSFTTDELRPNALLNPVLNPLPPPEYTFRGRNQQQGIQAIVDAATGYNPRRVDVSLDVPNVSVNPKAVGENSLDIRN
jgi:hypothetical protein